MVRIGNVLGSGNTVLGGRTQSQSRRALLHSQILRLLPTELENSSDHGQFAAPQDDFPARDGLRRRFVVLVEGESDAGERRSAAVAAAAAAAGSGEAAAAGDGGRRRRRH